MFKKKYLSNGAVCKVTFILPNEIKAKSVNLVGEFNSWDKDTMPMLQAKDGTWKIEIRLDAGHEFQFRYLVNGNEWHNDWEADKYVMHPYGGENSVVVT